MNSEHNAAERVRLAFAPFIEVRTSPGEAIHVQGRRLIPYSRTVRIGRLGNGSGGFGFVWNRPTMIVEELGEGIYRNHHVHDMTLRAILAILIASVGMRLLLSLLARRRG